MGYSLLLSLLVLAKATATLAADTVTENRSIDDIHKAALAEGGVVTCWHGGDEKNRQDALKEAFEKRFPGMTLNLTVDLSKYHEVLIDDQLTNDNVFVDSAILQTVHDYARWKDEGALLNYAPNDFDKVHEAFKDADGAYYGIGVFGWRIAYNNKKWTGDPIQDFEDFLNPELKGRIVSTYPNDDDAVLFAYDLIMQKYGKEWLDKLIQQDVRWVRGSITPQTLVANADAKEAATFIGISPSLGPDVNTTLPTDAQYVTWPQTAAILKKAPHPEGAKLLHNFLISKEWLFTSPKTTVRTDAPADYPDIFKTPNTNVTAFGPWIADRERVERLRFWFEKKLGTPQGLSPLDDDL
ncbi:periplasmic binding protein-like II [Aaosphaeria arxii CBS 175.79]|uniref:Periplasmic binding protein-like II n=1 Tax=Aaosphaeria arxii CBS 175.79 TaxID=1450172 RepID=A0A6A5X9U4_9PLEO|nr:periplasmic binding protein-like II [Aaosphaeria arxii CBS 175.79]KAF2009721.1 periplasmic binding protein-like II [Aaosphaeria arxii CBS 175.79]